MSAESPSELATSQGFMTARFMSLIGHFDVESTKCCTAPVPPYLVCKTFYMFQLTGVADSSFAVVWHAFTVLKLYCFAWSSVFSVHTAAAAARSDSWLRVHTAGTPAGLFMQVPLPSATHGCIIHSDIFPPSKSTFFSAVTFGQCYPVFLLRANK